MLKLTHFAAPSLSPVRTIGFLLLRNDTLAKFGLIGSMSALANPDNNAQAESFMKTLKVEEVYLAGFETFRAVVNRLLYFIDQN